MRAPFGATWDAVIDVFAASNIPIATIDRASGFIATRELRVGYEGLEWADCGTGPFGAAYPPGSGTYNVVVRGDSSSSTVRVTVAWTATPEGVFRCVTKGVWEADMEESIAAKAEGRKPLLATGSATRQAAPPGAAGKIESGSYVVVISGGADVHQGANANSPVIGSVPEGHRFMVTSLINDEWAGGALGQGRQGAVHVSRLRLAAAPRQ